MDARFPGSDANIEQKIRDIVPAQVYPGTLAELALASLTGKVPGNELRDLLEQERGNDASLQMLADLFDIIRPI